MARAVKEWIGKSDDTPVPPRVKLRVWENGGKVCRGCGRPLSLGERKICDHIVAIINGGENRERNLQTLGLCCEPAKTADDVRQKSETYNTKIHHAGFRKPKGRPMPGTKASGIRKRMSGKVEPWSDARSARR